MNNKEIHPLSEMSVAEIYNSSFKSSRPLSAFETKRILESIACVKTDEPLYKHVMIRRQKHEGK